ncbi:MAG: hypothetical protein AAFZ92_01805 [Pseudomonadota bacterium]
MTVRNNIDRSARDKTAELLRHFVSGQMTNFDFEDKSPNTRDMAVNAICDSIWVFYDDFDEHKLTEKNSLAWDAKSIVSRWILFLYSDYKYEWPLISHPGVRPLNHSFFSKLLGAEKKEKYFMSRGDYQVWPFFRVEDYEESKKSPSLLAYGKKGEKKKGTQLFNR